FEAGQTAKGAQLRQLVVGVGIDEILLQNIAANEVAVVGERVPQVEIAREDIADVHALLRQGIGPGSAEGSTEEGILAADTDPSGGVAHGDLAPVGTDAGVLGVRPLQLADAERKVVAQGFLLLRGELGGTEGRGGPSRGGEPAENPSNGGERANEGWAQWGL